MQLTLMTIVFIIFLGLQEIKAQVQNSSLLDNKDNADVKDATEVSTDYFRSDWKKVEIDFLNSYYSQDGNNAAVTGGIGTERLTDFTQKVMISIPVNPRLRVNVDGAYDYYSSASTDNIDNIRSSDSSSDVRSQFGAGMEYVATEQLTTGFRLGTSIEYDYFSVHGGFNFSYASKNGNRRLDFAAQSFYDQWFVFFPEELRGDVNVPTDRRQSYNAALSYSQVVTKRMQFSIMVEGTYMEGLLSTPFHRVYFKDRDGPDIERLPDNRLKLPLGMRMNYHLAERIIFRSYYRYYWDSWGMQGHTASIEMPIKLNRFFAIYPHYRYHHQTAVDHFLPYKENDSHSQFYTSDYDLSALSSHTFGAGILYSRPEGIASVKIPIIDKKLTLESIDLKGSIYQRSTGLNGFIISIGAKVSF